MAERAAAAAEPEENSPGGLPEPSGSPGPAGPPGSDEAPGDGRLTTATVVGGAWRAASVFGGAFVQFAAAVVLARLLDPEDFGTLAIVTVLLGIVQTLSYLGVGPAIVQRQTLRAEHVRTAWTLSCLTGLAAAAAFAAAAPLLAALVGDPDTTWVFVAMSPSLLLLGCRTCAQSLLRRDLRFKPLMVADIGSYLFGYALVSIAGALLGWGVWALVAGTLSQAAIALVVSYAYARHPLGLGGEKEAARDLIGFGGGITASGLANYIALNGDYFVVGRVLGAGPLGLYTRAYHLMNLPLSHGAQVLSQVLLPAYSKVQTSTERLAKGYIASVYLVFLGSAPVMMFLLLAAPELVPFLYGSKWTGVVVPLQILAAFGAFRATYHIGGAVVQASGRPWAEFMRQLLYATLVVGGAWIGSAWGLNGVAVAVGVAILVMYVLMARLSQRVSGFTWGSFFCAHRAGAVAAAAMLAVGIPLRGMMEAFGWHEAAELTVLAVVMGLSLLGAVGGLPLSWRPQGVDRALIALTGLLPSRLTPLARRLVRIERGASIEGRTRAEAEG